MNANDAYLVSPIWPAAVERLGWVLVHTLWQFALLAAVTLILQCLVRRSSAAARYRVLAAMMLLLVMTPICTWFLMPVNAGLARVQARVAEASPGTLDAPLDHAGWEASSAAADASGFSAEPTGRRAADTRRSAAAESRVDWWLKPAGRLQPWLTPIVAFWSLGVLAFSVRPILSWHTVRRLRIAGVAAVDDTVLHLTRGIQGRLGLRRSVQVLQSTVVQAPIVVGCLRSVILLPASLLTGLPAAQLEAILAHELAHVGRYDYLFNLAQTLIETVFFYHPAVWWLSWRIRIERENCCDDLAVAAVGDRVQYGRALLAIEEYRGAAAALAVAAGGGSLLERVRRLAGYEAGGHPLGAGSFAGLASLGLSLAAIAIWGVSFGRAANDDDGFGPPSHGLRCRIVALSPALRDEAPDLQRTANRFARPSEMTFGVELKNVGNQNVTLAGVRYGGGNQGPGKLDAFLAPHLFEFEFADRLDRPIARTQRAYYQAWMVLNGASTHELAPGESLKVLLRPANFNVPMDYDLPPGQYRVKVRYRGPDDSFREHTRKHWPDKAILKAWQHEVVSNTAEFSIAAASRRAKPEDLVWGKPQGGLRAATEFRLPVGAKGNPYASPGVPVGMPLQVVFHVRNVSDKPVTFVSETSRQGDAVQVNDQRGQKIKVQDTFLTGWPIDVAWTLLPGEVAQLHVLAPAINALDQPGRYTVRYTIRFNSRIQKSAGKVVFPRPGDYQLALEAGDTPLVLQKVKTAISPNGEIRGRLVDDETGQPIRGAVVACGAIINDSRRGGGASATTDSDGNYRLLPPSPGIYIVWLKKYRKSSMTAAADDGILVAAGKIAASQLRLTRGFRLTGRVIRQDGSPVPNAGVNCYSAARPQAAGGIQSVRTNDEGVFSITVPAGRTHLYTNRRPADDTSADAGQSADVKLIVPSSGEIPPITLKLRRQTTKFGSDEWLQRSTPGTKIMRHNNSDDVTGIVVDAGGQPVAGAQVFKHSGPIVRTNQRGEFRVQVRRGTQFVMHAFQPGSRVWFGAPTAGDELKIVLEKRQPMAGVQQLKAGPQPPQEGGVPSESDKD